MDRQVARWHALMAAGGPEGEGWARSGSSIASAPRAVDALRFVPAPRRRCLSSA